MHFPNWFTRDTLATMLSSPSGPTPTISQSIATALVSLHGRSGENGKSLTDQKIKIYRQQCQDITYPSKACSFTSVASADCCSVLVPCLLRIMSAASVPTVASMSSGSTSSNQISSLTKKMRVTNQDEMDSFLPVHFGRASTGQGYNTPCPLSWIILSFKMTYHSSVKVNISSKLSEQYGVAFRGID